MDPTVVVLFSFLIFMGIAWRFGYRQAMAILDHKIADIRRALEEAAQAKEAAVQALEEERQRHDEIAGEIDLIAKRAEEQAIMLREQALRDIDKIINSRHQAATRMMERMRRVAVQGIQEEVAATTLAVFEDLVTARFSPAQQEALNDAALAQITARLAKGATDAHKPKRARSKRSAVL